MASTIIRAQANFSYTSDGIRHSAASEEVKSYAAGNVRSILAKQIGTGVTPIAYAVLKNIPFKYTYTPAPGMWYDGLAGTIQITDEYFDQTTLVIQGTTVGVQIGSGQVFTVGYSLDGRILTIPVAGTLLETYTPLLGDISIFFDVQASLPQPSSVLGYASSMTYTTVEDTDQAIETLTATRVTGAAQIVAGAVAVVLTCGEAYQYVYDGDDVDYTILIEHVTGASEATISQEESIFVPDTGVVLVRLTGDTTHFEINSGTNQLQAKQNIILNDTSGQKQYEVTVHGRYNP